MSPEDQTDRLAKQLTLSDSVKAKVLDIFKVSDQARRNTFETLQGDRDAMRASMDTIRNTTDAKLKAVLTDEQYQKFLKAREEMMSRRGQGAPPPAQEGK